MADPPCSNSPRPAGLPPARNGKRPPVRCDARLRRVYLAFGIRFVCGGAVRVRPHPAALVPSALAIVLSLKCCQSLARQESAAHPPALVTRLDRPAKPLQRSPAPAMFSRSGFAALARRPRMPATSRGGG